jgi:Ca-activated chloride channel homolog
VGLIGHVETVLSKRWLAPLILSCAFIAACFWAYQSAGSFANLWLTPDQQALRAFDRRDYAEAAKRFRDPMHRGEALYRSGDFKEAAAAFARVDSAEGLFNRGDSLVMLGKYADAISSYEAALKRRPDWKEAQANRALAEARLRRLAPPTDDSEGTGGKEKPDQIVFDDRPQQSGDHHTQVVAGDTLSDDDIQALWLRRVQTKPADFLRAKFAYQLSRQQSIPMSP